MMQDKRNEKQRGQSIVLVAIMMVVLVLFVAIAVDMSSAYSKRRTAQNAADGAALAGARRLASQINKDVFNDTAIKIDMNDFAEKNGVEDKGGALGDSLNLNVVGYYLDADGVRISNDPIGSTSVPEGALGIEAITYITAPTYFGGIIGLQGLPLQADAGTLLELACGGDCIVPIATHARPFTDTDLYTITVDCFNIWNGDGPGEFGWLNWSWQEENCELYPHYCVVPPEECHQDDCSSLCISKNLNPDRCSSGFIEVGDWVAGTTGVVNDVKVRNELEYYIGIKDDPDHPPHPFTTIVYTTTNGMQGCGPWPNGLHYQVAGFAQMQLLGYKLAQGVAYDPWIDPAECRALGEVPNDPNEGNRLTAKFLQWGGGEGGRCYAVGSLLAPRLIW
jgi:hypothetical protein